MCTTCGCGHTHDHPHEHMHEHEGRPVGSIAVETDILARNNAAAARNRERFAAAHQLALNFVSSPGSGKTELLCATIKAVGGAFPIYVIEGDQQTANDADRIQKTGAKAFQINTGKGCHLEASMVAHALEHLDPPAESAVFIENVGNLVCPAEFDLGEAHKVAILSVTEGEDKPIKYPDMFRAADVMIINKIDLLPYLKFDVDACIAYAKRVNPKIRILKTSATTGEGLDAWIRWLKVELELAKI